jgi:hypothetical protein
VTAVAPEGAGRHDWVEAVWRFLASLELTLWLLADLGVASALIAHFWPSPTTLPDLRASLGEGAAFEIADPCRQ